jgi:tetratricopeptide (TPR) repeat protein
MERFSSLKHAPSETRRLLRERFARYLPSQNGFPFRAKRNVTFEDELLLRLFLSLQIDAESDFEKARNTYEAAFSPDSSEPSLQDLIESGWIRVAWGRIFTPFEIARAAESAPVWKITTFASLLKKRYEQKFSFSDAVRSNKDFVDTVAAIERGELEPRNIECQTPEWIAARLWDATLKDCADHAAALRVWVDRWTQLGRPWFIPNRAWSQTAADAFREAALNVLGTEPSLTDWVRVRTRFVNQIALADQCPISDGEMFVPAVPSTVFDRALWLDSRKLQRPMVWALDACDDMFGLIRLLLADVEAEDHASTPHSVAARLVALALDRPEILHLVLLRARQSPVLLADLLLYPATSALACLLIAQWQSPPSAWDRELSTRDDQTTKAIAFADAVSVIGHFLRLGSVRPEETASLLDWIHKNARPGFIDDLRNSESMLAALRGELAGQSPETLRKMVAALTASMPQSGLGTSTFAAALDIVDAGKLAGAIDPTLLINAYIESVAAGAYTLSANRVSVSGAASLFDLAMRTSSELRRKFFLPVNIKARMATVVAAGENIYTVTDTIARSIRAHIRILSRAVVGSIETAPDDLVNALITAVRAGALKHAEKGRIAAFSARYESDPFRGPLDRPIASDLGAALAALTEPHRERLLSEILEIDEPMVLAQLLSFAPHAARGRLEHRITELTPSEAGAIYSLTDAQVRIEVLLSVGLVDAAAQFMEAERDLKTLGTVPGRVMTRLRATLRLQLLRRDWTSIANTEPPSDLSPGEQSSALETINFYKAVAALMNPNGDRHVAEQMFAQLQHRRPDVVAYATNLFAARISLLLGGDLFGQLHDAALIRGRQVLVEAEQMMLQVRAIADSDSEIFTCNKALLLLAVGQPEQANELLTSLRAVRLRDGASAYAAVALARMGRAPEAMAILDQAEQALGRTDVLAAARAHIQSGKTFAAIANVLSENDPVRRVKAALFDLQQMDPIQQATVLQPQSEPFAAFVTGHVRSAAASLVSLVPMMKDVTIDSCEDDLSALIRELLAARFEFLGWSVPDQSKGGFTAKGNPGERDLLLQKNSTTLAVIEAVVCDRPMTQGWSRQELTSHFQKLLAYSTCSLFFHLIYSYLENSSSILAHLRQAAEHGVPAGFAYRSCEDIPLTDSRPVGFTARYAGQFGDIKVVFLVLDMSQYPQKEAANTAAKNNPRNTKDR